MAKINPFQKERDALAEEGRRLRIDIREKDKQLRLIQKDNDTAADLREAIFGLAEITPRPPKWIDHKIKSAGSHLSVPISFWSDWHIGERVFKNQVGGVNEFDLKIARARIRRLVDITISLGEEPHGRQDHLPRHHRAARWRHDLGQHP